MPKPDPIPARTWVFCSAMTERWMNADEQMAQGWVEGSTDKDWTDLPPWLQAQLIDAAYYFRRWRQDHDMVISGEAERRYLEARKP